MSKSPTIRLLLGLLVTLLAVAGSAWYGLQQIRGLRALQSQTLDLNRRDSLLLLQLQNDLNTVGLLIRDMMRPAGRARHSMTEFQSEFERLRSDLEQSIREESRMNPAAQRTGAENTLLHSLEHFRMTSDEVFHLAREGNEASARDLITAQLVPQQFTLSSQVLHLLERNNVAEKAADAKISAIYQGVETKIYLFLIAELIAIVLTSTYLMYSNRQLFRRLESLSRQRRILAARLISVQEEVLRSVSRELHDEFGQILTAVATMLARAEKKGLPPESPLRAELSEIRTITHNTLEKMRSLSQMLHPAVLDDYGLAKGIEWYGDVFQRQTGIKTEVVIEGEPHRIHGQTAINSFRIVQEALNNAAKHSGSKRAEVRLSFTGKSLTIQVMDFGSGMPAKQKDQLGLGLIAMRERAELINGSLSIASKPGAGTTVTIRMPLEQDEAPLEGLTAEKLGEIVKPLT